MKCAACKYEYDYDFIDGEKTILIGDEDFITTKTFVVYDTFYSNSVVPIYICPKCKTLRVGD